MESDEKLNTKELLNRLRQQELEIIQLKKSNSQKAVDVDLFYQAFKTSPDSININRLSDGLYIQINDGFTEITGFTQEDIKGKTSTDINIWAKPEDRQRLVNGLKEQGEVKNMEALFRMKDGKVVHGLMSARIIIIDGEQHILSITRNIESVKEKERKLIENERKFRSVFEMAYEPMCLVVKDEHEIYRILDLNQSFQSTLNFSKVELIDSDFFQLCPKEKIQSVKDQFFKIKDQKKGVFWTVYEKKDKTNLPVELSFVQLLNDEKETWLFVARDISNFINEKEAMAKDSRLLEQMISERTRELNKQNIKLEQSQKALINALEDINESNSKLKALNEELFQANEELEAFSYSISHDLRAPLTRIDGFSNLLINDYSEILDDQAKHYLNRIQHSSSHLADIIKKILSITRINKADMNSATVNITQICENILGELKQAEPERRTEFHIMPDMFLEADPVLIEVVIRNLIENSWKFSRAKEQTKISVSIIKTESRKTLVVEDEGVGFNMDYAQQLFIPFRRLHIGDEYEGDGIGLATVKRIVSRHRGKIWAESIEGVGANFFVQL